MFSANFYQPSGSPEYIKVRALQEFWRRGGCANVNAKKGNYKGYAFRLEAGGDTHT